MSVVDVWDLVCDWMERESPSVGGPVADLLLASPEDFDDEVLIHLADTASRSVITGAFSARKVVKAWAAFERYAQGCATEVQEQLPMVPALMVSIFHEEMGDWIRDKLAGGPMGDPHRGACLLVLMHIFGGLVASRVPRIDGIRGAWIFAIQRRPGVDFAICGGKVTARRTGQFQPGSPMVAGDVLALVDSFFS